MLGGRRICGRAGRRGRDNDALVCTGLWQVLRVLRGRGSWAGGAAAAPARGPRAGRPGAVGCGGLPDGEPVGRPLLRQALRPRGAHGVVRRAAARVPPRLGDGALRIAELPGRQARGARPGLHRVGRLRAARSACSLRGTVVAIHSCVVIAHVVSMCYRTPIAASMGAVASDGAKHRMVVRYAPFLYRYPFDLSVVQVYAGWW
mmetsp:Transcript_28873/g.83018  ORF Transcript_28873/g.83018 Transcript_28873/m.83018 type:complete len:203 (-) Transcript_28873:113-721(-)